MVGEVRLLPKHRLDTEARKNTGLARLVIVTGTELTRDFSTPYDIRFYFPMSYYGSPS